MKSQIKAAGCNTGINPGNNGGKGESKVNSGSSGNDNCPVIVDKNRGTPPEPENSTQNNSKSNYSNNSSSSYSNDSSSPDSGSIIPGDDSSSPVSDSGSSAGNSGSKLLIKSALSPRANDRQILENAKAIGIEDYLPGVQGKPVQAGFITAPSGPGSLGKKRNR